MNMVRGRKLRCGDISGTPKGVESSKGKHVEERRAHHGLCVAMTDVRDER
jgi:hypothetical protein